MNATPESKQKMMEALKRIHFDEEGRSVFDDEYMQDLNGEDKEPSGSGEHSEQTSFVCHSLVSYLAGFLLQCFLHLPELCAYPSIFTAFMSIRSFRDFAKCTPLNRNILLVTDI